MTVMPSALATAPKPRVLVVDSHDDSRELYRESFALAGWDVSEAADGRAGLVQAMLIRPSLVLTELILPIIDGVSLCEILRRDRETASVPILVVTTETRTRELDRARRAGANAVVMKPNTPDVILKEMQRLLDRREQLRDDGASAPPIRRRILSKAHERQVTTTPATPPLPLFCPNCTHTLTYRHTYLGGVSHHHPERWDYYSCEVGCGEFQYRVRTRKLRQI